MKTSISPGNYTGGSFNSLQNKFDNHDEIEFMPGNFDIGSNTILIRGPKKITGSPGSTFVKGTSGYLLANIIPVIADPNSKIGSGIFSILGDGAVSINGLNLEHTADPSPNPIEGNNAHGSGTICYFVDNEKTSSLVVTDCVIDTTATGAINVDSINPPNSAQPATHDLIIRRCKIPGRKPGPNHVLAGNPGAGNWLSVKLGPMPLPGANPVDMRSSYFEVNDCDLNPATFAAVAVWLCESDSASEFVIRTIESHNHQAPACWTSGSF